MLVLMVSHMSNSDFGSGVVLFMTSNGHVPVQLQLACVCK